MRGQSHSKALIAKPSRTSPPKVAMFCRHHRKHGTVRRGAAAVHGPVAQLNIPLMSSRGRAAGPERMEWA